MTADLTRFADLLADDVAHLAMLGVTTDDGHPHVTPVWFKWDGDFLIINSAKGRLKDRAMRARPHVALTVVDRNNFYHYVQVQGTIVDITEDGAFDVICDLALKYRGKREYPRIDGETRVTYKIRPDKVTPN